MSSIEKLEEILKTYIDCNGKESMNEEDALNIGLYMQYVIEFFKIQQAQIADLKANIEKLEANKCNCLTEEELANEKVGGTD